MDLKDKYEAESGYCVGTIKDLGVTYYSEDYVDWLEKQLNTPVDSVAKRTLPMSEDVWLKANENSPADFHNWYIKTFLRYF